MVPNEGDLWVKDVTQTTITINWEPIRSATGYFISAVGQFTGTRVDRSQSDGSNTLNYREFEFTDLIPGECYTIILRGIGVNRGGSIQQRTCKNFFFFNF